MTILNLSNYDLGHKSTPDLILKIQSLPEHTTELDLSYNHLYQKDTQALNAIIYALPTNIHTLDLSGNDLGRVQNLATVFQTLSYQLPHLTTLKLSFNCLGNTNHLTTILKALPRKITSLYLGNNALKLAKDLNRALEQLPSVTILSLNNNELQCSTCHFSSLPPTITTLNLAGNKLGCSEKLDIQLPISLTTLDISDNQFDNKTCHELTAFFNTLPSCITALYLRENKLGCLEKLDVKLPTSITMLDLSDNQLYLKTSYELADFFQTLPAFIMTLNLNNNKLGCIHNLHQAFLALPQQMRILYIEENELYRHINVSTPVSFFSTLLLNVLFHQIPASKEQELLYSINAFIPESSIFSALPPHINILYLSHNGLYHCTTSALQNFFKTLPQTISSLHLESNNLGDLPDTITTAIKDLPKIITTLHLSDNNFQPAHVLTLLENIPDHVQNIILNRNTLFHEHHKTRQKNATYFQTLQTLVKPHQRLSLIHTGLQEMSRTLESLLRIFIHFQHRYHLPVTSDLLNIILEFACTFTTFHVRHYQQYRFFSKTSWICKLPAEHDLSLPTTPTRPIPLATPTTPTKHPLSPPSLYIQQPWDKMR